MIMQQQSSEEQCNLLVQALIAKDEKLMQKVLEQEDEEIIKDVINLVPVTHVRKLVIELRDLISLPKLNINHLKWLQHLLALKYSVISSMADGRSVLLPLIALLEDRSAPSYYNKVQGLKGKLMLLRQLKEARRTERAETVVRVQAEHEQPAQMEIDSETDTESGEFDNESADEANDDNVELEGEESEIDEEDEEIEQSDEER